jgi:hypothetical protein
LMISQIIGMKSKPWRENTLVSRNSLSASMVHDRANDLAENILYQLKEKLHMWWHLWLQLTKAQDRKIWITCSITSVKPRRLLIPSIIFRLMQRYKCSNILFSHTPHVSATNFGHLHVYCMYCVSKWLLYVDFTLWLSQFWRLYMYCNFVMYSWTGPVLHM